MYNSEPFPLIKFPDDDDYDDDDVDVEAGTIE